MAAHRNASWALAGVAFLESSIFPIPPHAMLVPMVIADRAKAWALAAITSVSSVIGGIAGYAIGFFLFNTIGQPLLDFYGYGDKFSYFASQYNEHGGWIVFTAGVTPFPYKVITIASGATQLNFAVFLLASIAARSLIFFVIAALLYWFGPPIRAFIERYLGLVTIIFMVLLVGGFVLLKYLL